MEKPLDKPEVTATVIELYQPIEIIAARLSRYTAPSRQFAKLVWDTDFQSWCCVSRATGQRALIGPNNIKGVLFGKPAAEPAQAPAKALKPAKVA